MKDLNNAKKFKGIDRFITFNVQEMPFSLPTPSGIRSSPPSPAGSFRGASSLYCPGGCADTPVSPCKHGGPRSSRSGSRALCLTPQYSAESSAARMACSHPAWALPPLKHFGVRPAGRQGPPLSWDKT